MKIISYNVNGIRAALNKGFAQWVGENDFDLICLQETKALEEQVDTGLFEKQGYRHFWHSAEKKGYSGVAMLSKRQPDAVEVGCGMEEYDREGRVIRADFGDFTAVNIYYPSGSSGDERQAFKMRFLDDIYGWLHRLRESRPNLLVCGDYNICHQAIDIHDPVRNKNTSGFLPEERAWMDKYFGSGFVDTFRHLHPGEAGRYSWWSYRANARNNNKGWRIDYHAISESLQPQLKSADIFPDVKHSDHCPIFVELDV